MTRAVLWAQSLRDQALLLDSESERQAEVTLLVFPRIPVVVHRNRAGRCG